MYKTQGLTLPKVVLANTLNSKGERPCDRYLYVILSRLRALLGLTLLQKLPSDPEHSSYKLGFDLMHAKRDMEKKQLNTIKLNQTLFQYFNMYTSTINNNINTTNTNLNNHININPINVYKSSNVIINNINSGNTQLNNTHTLPTIAQAPINQWQNQQIARLSLIEVYNQRMRSQQNKTQ